MGSSSAGAQLQACWTPKSLWERGKDRTHLEASGSLKEKGVGRKPDLSLERGSGRILQRPELEGAGRLHRLGSVVWNFSVGREDRAHCSLGLVGQEKDWVDGVVREKPGAPTATSLEMENRLRTGEVTN